MEKKYMLTDETKVVNGRTLHRIKALKDFGDIEAGTLGGFIEKEKNLSQRGEAWVNENACVFEDARISNNAQIFGNALVYGYAVVCGNAFIFDEAQVYGNARIYDDTRVSGNAQVFGYARAYGSVEIYDNARIYDDAWAFDNVLIYENARICDNARAYESAWICGDSVVSQNQYVFYGIVTEDLSKTENLVKSIKAQCNLLAIDNKVIAYKLVRPDLTSFFDKSFHYEVGKEIEVKDCEESNESCASGLHFSNPIYWEKKCKNEEYVYLEAEIDLNDIITVQQGKIRCRKAKILRAFNLD